MKHLRLFSLAVLAVLSGGCRPAENEVGGDVSEASPGPAMPSNLPAPLVPAAEAGERGARNVLLAYVRALENGQLATAWALMGETARGQRSEAQFIAEWADLGAIMVAITDGRVEGAAGSLYYTSNATITARDAEGRPLRFEGPIVLRRANDVPGASVAQLRWHVERVDLAQTH